MKKILLDNITPGSTLNQDLFSIYGIKLVPRNTIVSQEILGRLRRVGRQFFLANDIRRLSEEHRIREVDPNIVRTGMDAPQGMLSLGGRLLNESAETIESHHKDSIQFGLFEQLDPEPDSIALRRRELADQIMQEHADRWNDIREERFLRGQDIEFDQIERSRWPHPDQLVAWREERVDRIRQQYARMLAGMPADLHVFELIVDELVGLLRQDPSRFAQVGLLVPQRCDYLPDHALSTSVLAMLVATRETYSLEGVRLAGLTGLLHDVGMLLVPERIRVTSEQGLSDIDRSRVLQHPAYSVALLDEIADLPEVVRWAAYRHHERDSGHGYPSGLKHSKIGELPRLIAVADVAAAMLGNRLYREEHLPFDAITQLVQLGRDGHLNRTIIRYLVDSIGIYPIGSYVRLSTGDNARVVGTHAGFADRPIVRLCDRTGNATRTELDLMTIEPWETSVLTAIHADDAANTAAA